MSSPILLIAQREFRTYVATLSFWLSLAIAPLAAGAVLLFAGGQQPPSRITIIAPEPGLARSARLALEETSRLDGRSNAFGPGGAKLTLSVSAPRTLDLTFSDGFPLSPLGRAMVGHILERDAARRIGGPQALLAVREQAAGLSATMDSGALSRLLSMVMLWLTLTGSLGMLLQAVVRERANRALESLLAAAQGWQIVAGKMLGVGAVSLLVLGVWGGTAAALSLFAGHEGPVVAITRSFSDPATLLRDALIYVCAFAFYGAITVALGAAARDSASAQNVVRPMFVLLLAAFFIALSTVGKQPAVSWLIYLPPFTPFLLLMYPPHSVATVSQASLLCLLLAASAAAVFPAARLLTIAPSPLHIFASRRRTPQPGR